MDRDTTPTWRVYERCVSAFQLENYGYEVTVKANARITGYITGVSRQVDVLIDTRWPGNHAERIIVDAKHYQAKVDIKEVESLESMMKDCRANRGIIVCPNGYTEGAKRRAQDAIAISVLTQEEVENDKWWAAFNECYGKCAQRSRNKGLVLWDAQHLLGIEGLWAIVYTGKCDACHYFHVWCWDCGEQFALSPRDKHSCHCERHWASVPVNEGPDAFDASRIPDAIHLMLYVGRDAYILDRRPLR